MMKQAINSNNNRCTNYNKTNKQEQEQSQMIKDLMLQCRWRYKANIEVSDAGNVKEVDGEH